MGGPTMAGLCGQAELTVLGQAYNFLGLSFLTCKRRVDFGS